jgi:hypothetical protein
VSNGARFAEHVARHGLLPVAGLFLVAGTGLEASRRLTPVPVQRASVDVMVGTADRTMPALAATRNTVRTVRRRGQGRRGRRGR